MVKIGPPGPKVNTLDVVEGITYADTSIETWQIIRFFLEELRPVNVAEIDQPEDRKCAICAEDFERHFHNAVCLTKNPVMVRQFKHFLSEPVKCHRAVRLPCGHVFGKLCIQNWLRPYASCARIGGERRVVGLGANTCPTCRREFFPAQTAPDTLPEIETRIRLWDIIYEYVGIQLSETERRARDDLLRYLDDCERDQYYPWLMANSGHTAWARRGLMRFCEKLKREDLTPVQEHLRQYMDHTVRRATFIWRRDDRNKLSVELRNIRETLPSDESRSSHVEAEELEAVVDEESEELAEGDTEEMRFFRAMFRSKL